MTPDNKGAHRPVMHDAPDSVTPMTTPSSAPDSTMQEAEAFKEVDEEIHRRMRSGTMRHYVILEEYSRKANAVIRVLMEQVNEYHRFRIRVFSPAKVVGTSHSTACTIWGDNGQGGTAEGFKEPLPCSCGALENFKQAHIESLEAERELEYERAQRIFDNSVGAPPARSLERFTSEQVAARVADRRKERTP